MSDDQKQIPLKTLATIETALKHWARKQLTESVSNSKYVDLQDLAAASSIGHMFDDGIDEPGEVLEKILKENQEENEKPLCTTVSKGGIDAIEGALSAWAEEHHVADVKELDEYCTKYPDHPLVTAWRALNSALNKANDPDGEDDEVGDEIESLIYNFMFTDKATYIEWGMVLEEIGVHELDVG